MDDALWACLVATLHCTHYHDMYDIIHWLYAMYIYLYIYIYIVEQLYNIYLYL